MRIAIDCRTLVHPGFGEGAGIGHYTYYLVKHLLKLDARDQFVLFFDDQIADEAVESITAGHPHVEVRRFPFHQYRKALPGIYSHFLLTSFFARARPSVLHVPGGNLPLNYRGPSVVTVHDLAIFEHPEWFPRQRISVNVLYPKTVRTASRLIAVSEATKNDLHRRFPSSRSKTSVVYPGVEIPAETVEDVELTYDLKRPYILFLGTIEPRKNVEGLIKAYLKLSVEYDLIIAGAPGWKYGGAMRAISDAAKKTHGRVRDLGYVPHAAKFELMRRASAFVFPTFYEGFGLPVLEALALGVPVVASDIPAIREVTGDAAVLVDPTDSDAIARGIQSVLSDEKLWSKLHEHGPRRAHAFSWEKTARETLEIYHKAAVN